MQCTHAFDPDNPEIPEFARRAIALATALDRERCAGRSPGWCYRRSIVPGEFYPYDFPRGAKVVVLAIRDGVRVRRMPDGMRASSDSDIGRDAHDAVIDELRKQVRRAGWLR